MFKEGDGREVRRYMYEKPYFKGIPDPAFRFQRSSRSICARMLTPEAISSGEAQL